MDRLRGGERRRNTGGDTAVLAHISVPNRTNCCHGLTYGFFAGMDVVVGGRGHICVAQKTGNRSDVHATFHSPGSEGVPQGVVLYSIRR